MKDQSRNNPDRLACRSCDAAIELHHFAQCAYAHAGEALVTNKHCNYDDLFNLPGEFQLDNLGTHYCHIRNSLRSAKKLILDIENLCRECDIKIPS